MLTQNDEISISGRLLMLNDMTPHVACVVQVVRPSDTDNQPILIATTLSDKRGDYEFVNLEPGAYQVRCYTRHRYLYYAQGEVLWLSHGRRLENVNFHFAPFKKGVWKKYHALDGLVTIGAHSIYEATDGTMWFATGSLYAKGSGVVQYDGRDFVTFTTKDGLMSDDICIVHGAPDGTL